MRPICMTNVAIVVAIGGVSNSFGGQLQPPAGPVAPTMKALDAIEPRICVSDLPAAAMDAMGRLIECECTHLICDSSGNTGAGFLIGDCLCAEVSSCSASGNGGSGVHVLETSQPVIVENTKGLRNGRFAVEVDGAGATVVRCLAAGNTAGGYSVQAKGNSMGPQADEVGVADPATANPFANSVR